MYKVMYIQGPGQKFEKQILDLLTPYIQTFFHFKIIQ